MFGRDRNRGGGLATTCAQCRNNNNDDIMLNDRISATTTFTTTTNSNKKRTQEDGNLFETQSFHNLKVTSIDTHLNPTNDETPVQIAHMIGSHYEKKS